MRGAVGDSDLRVMLAEIASAKACEMIRGSYRPLVGTNDRSVITGLLWIRDCKLTNDGTNVHYELGGEGWQWAEQTQKKAGGTFALHDYVKFGVHAKIDGALDIAYDTHDHVVSLWFSPSHPPAVTFDPIGNVDIDEKGLWSNIVGGVSTAFGSSPDEQGAHQAKKQGTNEFENQLAEGMTVATDLCTGYQRFTLGRPAKGQLGPPNPGETLKQPIELANNGMIVFGPYLAPDGMSMKVDSDGPLHVELACAKDVEPVVDAFVHTQALPGIAVLAQADITGSGHLAVPPQRCKVVAVVSALTKNKVRFSWTRPPAEIARSTGGPAIRCDRKGTLSSDNDAAAGSGAARAGAPRRR